jgi:hypothetical protein
MINLDYVKPENKLKVQQYNSELFALIVAKIREIEGYDKLRFDNELLKFVCVCIENGVNEKYAMNKKKTDKKKLAMDIITTVFTMNESEKLIIHNAIDFLCDNNMIIKYSGFKKYTSIIGSYLKSKL